MARYSPGLGIGFPTGCVVALPFLFSIENMIPVESQLIGSQAQFSSNRFELPLSSVQFSDPADYLSYSLSQLIDLQEGSFCFWAKLNSAPNGRTFIYKQFPGGGQDYSFAVRTQNANPSRPVFFLKTSTSNYLCSSQLNFGIGVWYHIYCEFGDGEAQIYINANPRQSRVYTGVVPFASTPLIVGNDDDLDNAIDGCISDFYFFAQKLTQPEIDFMYGFYLLRRGSSEGSTFQKIGNSFAIRHRKKPIPHRTVRNSNSHSAFHNVQSNIQNLSPPELAAYTSNSPSFPRLNSLGQTYNLKGFNLFNSQNVPLVNQGLPINNVSSPPVVLPSPVIANVFFEPNPTDIVILTNPAIVPADFIFECWASNVLESPPSDPGTVTLFRMTSRLPGETMNQSFGSFWDLKFGSSINADGLYCVLRLDIVSVLTGQKTTYFIDSVQIGL